MIFRMFHIYWYVLPLVVAISLVYCASRHESWRRIWVHAFRLCVAREPSAEESAELLALLRKQKERFAKPGAKWRFALCRYDYSATLDNPELSSTAPLTQPSFHRYEDYGALTFVGQK